MSSKEIIFPTITKEQIRDYCEASGDWNKIHWDETFAREAGLPGVIAHGMLTMGLAALALEKWGYSENLKNYEAKFKGMALPGDQLKAELISEPSGSNNPGKIRIINQRNEEILQGTFLVS